MRRSKTGAATEAREEPQTGFTPPSRATVAYDRPERGASSGSRLAVRNWRVRTRLYAILLIPVAVGLVFGGFRVADSVDTWQEARDAQHTAELVRAAADYGNALIDERDRTAAPLLAGRRNDPAVDRARLLTDRAKGDFDRAAAEMPDKPGLKRRLATFRKVEPKLPALRAGAYTKKLGAVKTEEGYVAVQHPLMEFANELGFGTDNMASYGRTVYSVSLGKAAQSLERSIGMHLLVKPGPGKSDLKRQYTALTSYAYLERIAMEEYVGGGSPEDIKLLKKQQAESAADGKKLAAAARAKAKAQRKPFVPMPPVEKAIPLIVGGDGKYTLAAKGITPESWMAANTLKFDAYRAVEKDLTDQAVAESEQISDDAANDAWLNGAIVVVALLLAFFLAGMMARSMSRSMGSLRTAAFDVAEQRLPMLVDQLSRTDPGRVDTRVAPIPIGSSDEIGEVARAFDQVHREAVRLASEQALLRGNVNAIFTNLSSRNQGLIERQLGLISDLENNEADPDQLENLFRLDHLATRMRRNGENLLVLAGEDPPRSFNEPIPLVDILRAASSEVEHYERIGLSGIPESEIHGEVVNDLVHLLAELLENATTFSAPQSKVDVTATRLPDARVVIEIHDKGIGLTAEDFAEINYKLANPPTVDAALARRMGLYVVGRLADRHGIRVQLRPSAEQVGTTCLVMLPEGITQGGGGEEDPYEEDFTVSRIMPEAPAPLEQARPPAGELGFGSERVPDDLSSLGPVDSVGRARQRDEILESLEERQPGAGVHGGDGVYGGDGHDGAHGGNGRNGSSFGPDEPWTGAFQKPARPQHSVPPQAQPPEAEQDREYRYGDPWQTEPRYPAQESQYPSYGGEFAAWNPEAESSTGVHETGGDRVGFDRSGPSPSTYRTTTGAGLPRRESGRVRQEREPAEHHQQDRPQPEPSDEWRRTANDERWSRAGGLRDPQSGGTTQSGLPRRVPRANLVSGTAESTSQGGPQVSRSPEDVRGRLSNLHRGVRRGRVAGGPSQNDREGFGPGSTYDQER